MAEEEDNPERDSNDPAWNGGRLEAGWLPLTWAESGVFADKGMYLAVGTVDDF